MTCVSTQPALPQGTQVALSDEVIALVVGAVGMTPEAVAARAEEFSRAHGIGGTTSEKYLKIILLSAIGPKTRRHRYETIETIEALVCPLNLWGTQVQHHISASVAREHPRLLIKHFEEFGGPQWAAQEVLPRVS